MGVCKGDGDVEISCARYGTSPLCRRSSDTHPLYLICHPHPTRSAKVPDRENHIRGDIAWQGYVALETTVGEMDLTALVSTGFGGGSFRIPQAFTRPALVKYTTMGHTLKLKLIAANQEKKQGGEGEEGADN